MIKQRAVEQFKQYNTCLLAATVEQLKEQDVPEYTAQQWSGCGDESF